MKQIPKLTVSMPARNTARFVGQAIESVLSQTGVDFELIVVDDASDDETASIVEGFQDRRVRLIRNERRRGIGYCHNRVIDESDAPFIAHVDSDDYLLPGALAKMVEKLESNARLGQVHCFTIEVDEFGETTREAFREQQRSLMALHRDGMDYRLQLIVLGMVANHLRTYRREVFEKVGRFDEGLSFADDYRMSLRLLDAYEIAVVPEFLYCRRTHGHNISAGLKFSRLRFWLCRCREARALTKSGAARYLRRGRYSLRRALLLGLADSLGICSARYGIQRWLSARQGWRGIVARGVRLLATRLYYQALERLGWWPLDWGPRRRRRAQPTRIGSYPWRFPLLSETFIRRELRALERQGLEVRVFADAPADLDYLDDDARALLEKTDFLNPVDPHRMASYRRHFFRKNPLAYLNVMLYVLFHRYDYWKTLSEDRAVFRNAVYLAGLLRDRRIDHIHVPWADRNAFVAILAAKLQRIPCSVQPRAYELHRRSHRYALREKFTGADFVVTNCRFNEETIRSSVDHRGKIQLHTVYEGVNLQSFDPEDRSWDTAGPLRILCVARIIEEKGIEYLLRACALLKRAGTEIRCDVIGEADRSNHADYVLRVAGLHRSLELEDCLHFLGPRPFTDVQAAHRSADVFVLPCVVAESGGRDITPNALIEAMAMQLPVVSTLITAIPEIVEDGVSGLLVPPQDPKALADAITMLAGDAALRERLGRNARRRVEERFDLDRNIVHLAELFQSARQ